LGRVLASIKIFPKEITVNLAELRQKIEKNLPANTSIHRFNEEPIAFGLVALVAHVLMGDEEGKMNEVEANIKSIDDVSEIQIVSVSLV